VCTSGGGCGGGGEREWKKGHEDRFCYPKNNGVLLRLFGACVHVSLRVSNVCVLLRRLVARYRESRVRAHHGEAKTITVNGRKMNVEIAGTGSPTVIINAGTSEFGRG
jgi:hypothetical protein